MKRNALYLCLFLTMLMFGSLTVSASSHREAPLISQDALADNTDLYAFRSFNNPDNMVIIANYIPFQLPEGGPNYYTFDENVRYEIHIKNKTDSGFLGIAEDDVTYRFTFNKTNEDPSTFFNIRLGLQNQKTTYTAEKSTDGGNSWTTIVSNGIVPPNNIGQRSIEGAAGLNTTYDALVNNAIMTASSGEKVFAGPRDDAFFVDLGGIFDLGQTRSEFGSDPSNPNNARDGLAGFNVHSIAIEVPISELQKDGKNPSQANSLLDSDFIIGVWASASRPQIKTLDRFGGEPQFSGPHVQVSRLGNPLVNEAIIPIGAKDSWNNVRPYDFKELDFVQYFVNPELALYMDDALFGGAVPSLSALRVQSQSYPAVGTIPGYSTPGFDFRNGKDGAFAATNIPGIDFSGTALDVPTGPVAPGVPIPTALVAPGEPRRADIFAAFYFGIPALPPYELAHVKTGGPLSQGKPFINNFLPHTEEAGILYGGDMLRVNMAVPPTDRNSSEYQQNSHQGLIRAAVLGLTDPGYDNYLIESIPHMDGFPNGRRMEDDVTTIALQAIGGLLLGSVGFPFDDAVAPDYSDLISPALIDELDYNAGPTSNDVPLLSNFPYLASPHRGYDYLKKLTSDPPPVLTGIGPSLGIAVPRGFILEQNYPNPFNPSTTIRYNITRPGMVKLQIFDALGRRVAELVNEQQGTGTHEVLWEAGDLASGSYFYRLEVDNDVVTRKSILIK